MLTSFFLTLLSTSFNNLYSSTNNRMAENCVDTKREVALRTPIRKFGNMQDVLNHREISILNCLPKNLENMILEFFFIRR